MDTPSLLFIQYFWRKFSLDLFLMINCKVVIDSDILFV